MRKTLIFVPPLALFFSGCFIEPIQRGLDAENAALKEENQPLISAPPAVSFETPAPTPLLPPFPIYGGIGGNGHKPKKSVCGNRKLEPREECDDGNEHSYDGCSADCLIEPLLSVAQGDDQLRVINRNTGETVCQRTIRLNNFNIAGANALATNPLDGSLWAILRRSGQNPPRVLVQIDPLTGVATLIGTPNPTGIAGLAFDDQGTLYAVTGDGGNPSETLFTIDTGNANATLFLTLGNGNDGEAIAFNQKDGYLYHSSGRFSGPAIFERINLETLNITSLWSSTETEEIAALTYLGDVDSFLANNIGEEFFKITSSGEQVKRGKLDHLAKGLAFSSPTNGCKI